MCFQLTFFQVLGSKPLNGSAEKLRLKLWDGEVEMTQAVLCLEGRKDLDVPSTFSVIKLEGVRVKKAGANWAAIISGEKYSWSIPFSI